MDELGRSPETPRPPSLEGANLLGDLKKTLDANSVPAPGLPPVQAVVQTPLEADQRLQSSIKGRKKWLRFLAAGGLTGLTVFGFIKAIEHFEVVKDAAGIVHRVLTEEEQKERLAIQAGGMELKFRDHPEKFLIALQGGQPDDPINPRYRHNCMILVYERFADENGLLDLVALRAAVDNDELEQWIVENWSTIVGEYEYQPEMETIISPSEPDKTSQKRHTDTLAVNARIRADREKAARIRERDWGSSRRKFLRSSSRRGRA